MTLTLHYHPLASFCWKALIAFYENETPFERVIVDLGDETSRAAHYALWPMGKMPVLRDEARGETVPESSAVIDYLDRYYPGPVRFTPADPDLAWRTRLWDRFFDSYVHHPLQKIVSDRIRQPGARDAEGVATARDLIARAYGIIRNEAGAREWFSGKDFGLADCAAAPSLYYANRVQPLGPEHEAVKSYLDRLMARASFQRVIAEAEPYFQFFPEG